MVNFSFLTSKMADIVLKFNVLISIIIVLFIIVCLKISLANILRNNIQVYVNKMYS